MESPSGIPPRRRRRLTAILTSASAPRGASPVCPATQLRISRPLDHDRSTTFQPLIGLIAPTTRSRLNYRPYSAKSTPTADAGAIASISPSNGSYSRSSQWRAQTVARPALLTVAAVQAPATKRRRAAKKSGGVNPPLFSCVRTLPNETEAQVSESDDARRTKEGPFIISRSAPARLRLPEGAP